MLAAPAGKFGRADELVVYMRPAGQHAHHIFGTDNRQGKSLGSPVDGGKEDMPPWLDQTRAGLDHRTGVGYVLEHFHTGHDIELTGVLSGHGFGAGMAVIHLDTALQRMQARHAEGGFPHVDAGYPGPTVGHGFGQNAAATAYVDDLAPGQPATGIDKVQP